MGLTIFFKKTSIKSSILTEPLLEENISLCDQHIDLLKRKYVRLFEINLCRAVNTTRKSKDISSIDIETLDLCRHFHQLYTEVINHRVEIETFLKKNRKLKNLTNLEKIKIKLIDFDSVFIEYHKTMKVLGKIDKEITAKLQKKQSKNCHI